MGIPGTVPGARTPLNPIGCSPGGLTLMASALVSSSPGIMLSTSNPLIHPSLAITTLAVPRCIVAVSRLWRVICRGHLGFGVYRFTSVVTRAPPHCYPGVFVPPMWFSSETWKASILPLFSQEQLSRVFSRGPRCDPALSIFAILPRDMWPATRCWSPSSGLLALVRTCHRAAPVCRRWPWLLRQEVSINQEFRFISTKAPDYNKLPPMKKLEVFLNTLGQTDGQVSCPAMNQGGRAMLAGTRGEIGGVPGVARLAFQ